MSKPRNSWQTSVCVPDCLLLLLKLWFYNYSLLTLNFAITYISSHGNNKYWLCILNTIIIDYIQIMLVHLSHWSVEQKMFSWSSCNPSGQRFSLMHICEVLLTSKTRTATSSNSVVLSVKGVLGTLFFKKPSHISSRKIRHQSASENSVCWATLILLKADILIRIHWLGEENKLCKLFRTNTKNLFKKPTNLFPHPFFLSPS